MTGGSGRVWQSDDGTHIDVRGLPPPEPLVAIIALIEGPEAGDLVIVHHDRDPVFLYPELDLRNWGYEVIPGDMGEVRLRLTRRA